MHPPRPLSAKTYPLLALMVVFSSVGNVLLSEGMKRVGVPDAWTLAAVSRLFFKALGSGTVWLGIATLLLFFVSNMLVLSWADYSYVSPASAVGYALVAFLGYAALGERVSALRWMGLALICSGVLLVGRTPFRTSKRKTI